ncbi:hypothetical protein MHU86_21232 [Fragilaria crotonensis]|nr:hypothetical protein MHU86_21232 [Fragilaria crotonensis]
MVRYVPPPDSIFQRFLIIAACGLWLLLLIGGMSFYIGEQAEIAHMDKVRNTPVISLGECKVDEHIVNCGNCGQCSNRDDIQVYEDVPSLTAAIDECSRYAFLFGWYRAEECLKKKLSLSKGCTNCWMLNAECRKSLCFHICAKQSASHFFLSNGANNSSVLDKCEECKDLRCGGYLDQCAGATPHRVGIASSSNGSYSTAATDVCQTADWNYIRGVVVDAAAQTVENVDKVEDDLASEVNDEL